MSRKHKSKWREVVGLREILEFASGKTIVADLSSVDMMDIPSFGNSESGIRFTDGSMLACRAEERGFGGSDVTAPDPPEVIYYVAEKSDASGERR